MQRVRDLEHSVLNRMSPLNHSFQISRDPTEEEVEEVVEPEGMEDIKRTRSSKLT